MLLRHPVIHPDTVEDEESDSGFTRPLTGFCGPIRGTWPAAVRPHGVAERILRVELQALDVGILAELHELGRIEVFANVGTPFGCDDDGHYRSEAGTAARAAAGRRHGFAAQSRGY